MFFRNSAKFHPMFVGEPELKLRQHYRYVMYRPAFTGVVCPLIYSHSTSNRATSPIFDGRPRRPSGMVLSAGIGKTDTMSLSIKAGPMAPLQSSGDRVEHERSWSCQSSSGVIEGEIMLWAVRWYCRCGISHRYLEQMMGKRGVPVDQSTIYR